MNLDDLLCTGIHNNILFSSTIDRNKKRIPGDVLETIINGTQEYFDGMKEYGIDIHFLGGETADVGDVVRTVRMGEFSMELCGGTHLKSTAEAGLCRIVSESGVGANLRRLEALTGAGDLPIGRYAHHRVGIVAHETANGQLRLSPLKSPTPATFQLVGAPISALTSLFCHPPLAVASQLLTCPMFERHRMSSRPSPLKSPVAAICQ